MPTLPPAGPTIAVLMPIRRPSSPISAPPLLPGLIDASVWMKSSKRSMPSPERPSAETMPEVTVWPSPNGLPIAIEKSPTRSASESAQGSSVRPSASMRSTATSASGSVPTSVAGSSRPSASVTSTPPAPSIT